jgi:hypothetical protein
LVSGWRETRLDPIGLGGITYITYCFIFKSTVSRVEWALERSWVLFFYCLLREKTGFILPLSFYFFYSWPLVCTCESLPLSVSETILPVSSAPLFSSALHCHDNMAFTKFIIFSRLWLVLRCRTRWDDCIFS